MLQWSEWNSLLVAWVGLVRAMPPSLAGRLRDHTPFHLVVVCLWVQWSVSSDDHFEEQNAWATAMHSASEVSPLADNPWVKAVCAAWGCLQLCWWNIQIWSHHSRNLLTFPAPDATSAYHTWLTLFTLSWGMGARAYIGMAGGSPWVVPSTSPSTYNSEGALQVLMRAVARERERLWMLCRAVCKSRELKALLALPSRRASVSSLWKKVPNGVHGCLSARNLTST